MSALIRSAPCAQRAARLDMGRRSIGVAGQTDPQRLHRELLRRARGHQRGVEKRHVAVADP